MRAVSGYCFATVVLCGTLFAQSGQPVSLADLAAATHSKKAAKVFTEDDLPQHHGSDAPGDTVTAPTRPQADPGTQKGIQELAQKKSSVAPTPAELRSKIAAYQQEQTVWSDSVKQYQEKLANDRDEFRRKMYQEAIENDEHNAAYYQQKIADVQNQLEKAEANSPKKGDAAGQPQSPQAQQSLRP